MSASPTMSEQVPQTAIKRLLAPDRLRKLAYALMALGAVWLAATGLAPFVLGKPALSGWLLMLHVAGGPMFAVGLALVALTWAGVSRLDAAPASSGRATRLVFWLLLASGLMAVLSAVVAMTPLFGTCGQHALVVVHFYSAILAAVFIVLHLVGLSASGRNAGAKK